MWIYLDAREAGRCSLCQPHALLILGVPFLLLKGRKGEGIQEGKDPVSAVICCVVLAGAEL